MKILFVAAECTPVIKVGGLADVVGALPKALQAAGHDVRIVIPKYDQIDTSRFPSTERWSNLEVPWNGQKLTVHIDEGRLPNSSVPLYYLDCPAMFHPGNILHRLQSVYANSGDPEMLQQELQRFIFFSLAVATTLPRWEWQPDVLHLNDWHTALVATLAKLPGFPLPPTLLTIHNLQNQGRWNADDVWKWLNISGDEHAVLGARDSLGNANLLQLGILAATSVNTVSPTYAKEILTKQYGDGLENSLKKVAGGVSGVLNGIDTEAFDPTTDPALAARYAADTVAVGKQENRKMLGDQLGWRIHPEAPLIVSVGRLTAQKGYQLLPAIADWLLTQNVQLVILGSGTPDVQSELELLSKKYPNFHLRIGFDAKLAQLLYAAGDLFLMPSEFEPCGLGQMIAMRYGTLPIVRETGGLKDTVIDLTKSPKRGTGFVFEEFSPAGLKSALERSIKFVQSGSKLHVARTSAMSQDFSWQRSSQDYIKLYGKISRKK